MVVDEKNITKSVLKLAIPSVSEQVLFMIVGVVSTIFVGRLGNQEISAVGLVNTLTAFIIALFVALSTGCTVIVARLIGEEDEEGAKEAVRQSVFLGTASSILFSIILYIFSYYILKLFFGTASAEVIDIANAYFKITIYTFPLLLINTIISGSMRGAGDTTTPMIIASIVNVLNAVLGYVFIFGINTFFISFEGIGVIGAALAVAISRGFGGLLSIIVLVIRKSNIRFSLVKRINIHFPTINRIFKIGIPASLEQIIMQGGFLMLQIVIAGMGTVAMAVYQIGMSINSIAFIPSWGLGIAATTLVGQSLGAKRIDLAEKSGWKSLEVAMVVIVVLTSIIFVFSKQLVMLYSNDPEVIEIGTMAIRIFSISQPFLAVVVVFSSSLRGAGDIMYVMITSFVGIWVFRVAITALLGYTFGLGIMGVWIALCIDFFIRAIMYLLRFKKGKWKHIRV